MYYKVTARYKDDEDNATFEFIADTEDIQHIYRASEDEGEEILSKEIKELIRAQEEKYGWEFLFVAANIDAVETAENIGIRPERAANYNVEKGTRVLFCEMADTVSEFRRSGKVRENWAENIEKTDKNKRK